LFYVIFEWLLGVQMVTINWGRNMVDHSTTLQFVVSLVVVNKTVFRDFKAKRLIGLDKLKQCVFIYPYHKNFSALEVLWFLIGFDCCKKSLEWLLVQLNFPLFCIYSKFLPYLLYYQSSNVSPCYILVKSRPF
jgi:hypothetical protein